MIIAFADDQTAEIFADIGAARTHCETIDVESGIYQFFDDHGRPLRARITRPTRRTSLAFGLKVIGDGSFDLEPDVDDEGAAFEKSFARIVAIEPNPNFATIADLKRYVDENRRRG